MNTCAGRPSSVSHCIGRSSLRTDIQLRFTASDFPCGMAIPSPIPVFPWDSLIYKSCLNSSLDVMLPSFKRRSHTHSNLSLIHIFKGTAIYRNRKYFKPGRIKGSMMNRKKGIMISVAVIAVIGAAAFILGGRGCLLYTSLGGRLWKLKIRLK